MDLRELLDYLALLPETTGSILISRDELFGVYKDAGQDHGYTAVVAIKGGVRLVGRGLTPGQALDRLVEKVLKKFPESK